MSATLEEVALLSREYDLADSEYQRALDTIRRSAYTLIAQLQLFLLVQTHLFQSLQPLWND